MLYEVYRLGEDSLQKHLHHDRRVGEDNLYDLRLFSDGPSYFSEEVHQALLTFWRYGIGVGQDFPPSRTNKFGERM